MGCISSTLRPRKVATSLLLIKKKLHSASIIVTLFVEPYAIGYLYILDTNVQCLLYRYCVVVTPQIYFVLFILFSCIFGKTIKKWCMPTVDAAVSCQNKNLTCTVDRFSRTWLTRGCASWCIWTTFCLENFQGVELGRVFLL